MQFCMKDEAKLIENFLIAMRQISPETCFLLTKNGKSFDLPFILSRIAMTTDLSDRTGLFLTDFEHFDLQKITKKRIGLSDMAILLGCKHNKIGTGLDAIKLWNEGKLDKLMEYNKEDLLTTEEVFIKYTSNRSLQ